MPKYCRDGETISRPLLTVLISMLTSISTISHATVFVTPFLTSSNTYYQQEGHRLLQASSETGVEMEVATYLQHVQRRLVEEAERCDLVIGAELKGQIIRVVEDRLIGEHASVLLTRGLPKMLDEGKMEDLSSMYSFMGRVNARKQMQQAFGEYVKVRSHKAGVFLQLTLVPLPGSRVSYRRRCIPRRHHGGIAHHLPDNRDYSLDILLLLGPRLSHRLPRGFQDLHQHQTE